MRPFTNVLRLFQGLSHALKQPEVQGAAQLALSLIVIATIFYRIVEGWSLLDAAYFSVVTIATVGYGDLSPIPRSASFSRSGTSSPGSEYSSRPSQPWHTPRCRLTLRWGNPTAAALHHILSLRNVNAAMLLRIQTSK